MMCFERRLYGMGDSIVVLAALANGAPVRIDQEWSVRFGMSNILFIAY
ncbi:hypothetical protein EMIT0158MI4_60257 [Burkholderia ambifaria]